MEKAMRIARFTLLMAICAGATTAKADEPSVTAVLDSSETVVGQPVQLQIKVSGARNATMPDNFNVAGLDIRYSGQSQQIEGRNFQFSYSVVYSYTIMPERAGSFKIPPQPIRIGGKTLRTPELSLNVANTSGGSAGTRGQQGAIDPSKIAFVELVVAKTSAYVGEMIPAEVRLGFSTRTPAESLGNGIDLTGQGFTTQKMRDPRQTIETIRGKSYQMFIFKTAISPVRAGKIDVGPIEANPVVRVPQGNRARPSIRDPFSLNDPFFDNFFNDPAFAPSMPRQIKLRSEAAALDVKPLPPNAPPSFSGAVGTFTMTSDAKPLSGKAGDPITVTSNISGRGNFDRVAAPILEDDKGWHKYPPSSQFKQDDDVGISGTKTFETVISANERKEKLPPFAFTFFDPLKEQYVTLRSDAIPVHIEGGAAATPSPAAPAAAASPRAQPTAAPNVSPAPAEDILYQLTQLPARQESFRPMFRRREFWLAQLIPLLALLAFIVIKWRRVRANDRDARRAAELQHEAAELQRRLRRNDLPPREYFADAARAVQLKTAVRRKVAPHNVDADFAASTFRVDDETRSRLRELFARSDELRYSGGGNGATAISAEHRREIVELIERLSA